MKLNTIVFVLIVLGLLGIGIAIERYGRTCPACKRRKKAIMDALAGNGDSTVIQGPNGGPSIEIEPELPTIGTVMATATPLVKPTVAV